MEHETQVKYLATHFNVPEDKYSKVILDIQILRRLKTISSFYTPNKASNPATSKFQDRNLEDYKTFEEAYHQLIIDIMEQQVKSTRLILESNQVRRIFVDGGFSKNPIYMYLMAQAFPEMEIYAASVPQASALGAALVIHDFWNKKPFPTHLIDLKLYSVIHSSIQ